MRGWRGYSGLCETPVVLEYLTAGFVCDYEPLCRDSGRHHAAVGPLCWEFGRDWPGTVEMETIRNFPCPVGPNERPVKAHTLDRREAKKAIHDAVSRPVKPQHLDRADRGIDPGKKPR